MFTKMAGLTIAAVACIATVLSAADAEAACCRRRCHTACHTHCCDPCSGTVVEVAPCATTGCWNGCGRVVVEEVVVSGCCMAAGSTPARTLVAAAPTPPTPRIAARPVSVAAPRR